MLSGWVRSWKAGLGKENREAVHYWGFPGGAVVKNLPANAEDIRDALPSLDQENPLK